MLGKEPGVSPVTEIESWLKSPTVSSSPTYATVSRLITTSASLPTTSLRLSAALSALQTPDLPVSVPTSAALHTQGHSNSNGITFAGLLTSTELTVSSELSAVSSGHSVSRDLKFLPSGHLASPELTAAVVVASEVSQVSQGLHSSSGVSLPSPDLPGSSPGLPTSGLLSPSQIKQEFPSPKAKESSLLLTELLSSNVSSSSKPSVTSGVLIKREQVPARQRRHPTVKTQRHPAPHAQQPARVKEEYPDLCDMVGVDKTTYLDFLNNPILPSISEVEQLLEQCSSDPIHRPTEPECVQKVTEYMEQSRHSLSPSYTCYEEDPSMWQATDFTTLLPPAPASLNAEPVSWSTDVSNHGYDSNVSIESPRSTGSLESEEPESSDYRLPMAVENMDDVGIMTSQMEESSQLPCIDDDFGSFEVDEEKAYKKRRKGLHLWEFLLEVLDDERHVPHLLYWVERSKGIFKIEKSQEVAKLWGRRKQRNHMTYEHMSRAMRHYYSSGIMRRIPGKRLMYQFGPRAFANKSSS